MALQTHIRSSDTIFSAPGTVSALQDIIGNSSASVEVTQSKCLKFSSKKKKKKKNHSVSSFRHMFICV